jgi:hypothetical protein
MVRIMIDLRSVGSGGVIPIVAFAFMFVRIGFCVRAGMFLAKWPSLIGLVSGEQRH